MKLKEGRFEKMVKQQWQGKDKHEYEFTENSSLKKVDPQKFFAHDDMLEVLKDLSIKAKS